MTTKITENKSQKKPKQNQSTSDRRTYKERRKLYEDRRKKAFEEKQEDEIFPTYYEYNNHRYMWSDDIYKEWFRYAQLLKQEPIYFLHMQEYKNTDEWWEKSIPAIKFGEPLKDNAVIITDKDEYSITIKINLSFDRHRIIQKLTNLLFKYIKGHKIKSRASYQPSKPMKQIRLKKLIEAREVYMLRKDGLSNMEIALEMDFLKENKKPITSKETYEYFQIMKGGMHTVNENSPNKEFLKNTASKAGYYDALIEAADKRIARHIKAVDSTLSNIENNTFP